MISLTSWVLAAMVLLQPPSSTTTKIADSYAETAEAIAHAASDAPLFAGPEGERQTAALLIAVALHESSFRPWALGDHDRSVGLFQVQPTTSGDEREDLLIPKNAARSALRLLRSSFRICRDRPLEERLSWYAGGGGSCPDNAGATSASRAMFSLARRVLAGKGQDYAATSVRTFKPDLTDKKRPALVAVVNKSQESGTTP